MPPLLARIQHPTDVARLTEEERTLLAAELRNCIVETVGSNGGHLAPSLGVVELTLALLTVFNPEHDKVIWDVGHQSYAWKLLTGRAETFDRLRLKGGPSGFIKPSESPYDHFGVGHSSTSISAALGMAMARDLKNDPHHVVAVIGDGSLTGGLAFEALNQAGAMKRRLIVILNDNEMSISENVGALSNFLSRKMSGSFARYVRREMRELLRSIPRIGEDIAVYASRTHRSLKSMFTPGMLFEAFNFEYLGPIDGHNPAALEESLRAAATMDDKPVLLHVLTKKGKGYAPAEADPARFHGIGRFDVQTGESPQAPSFPPSYTKVFSQSICALAEHDPKLVVITAAMPGGTGTDAFRERFPERFVDVGICEDHAVTFAAGLAKEGYHPFVAVYSTFLQRAYDHILHDVCLQNLPVTLCIDRAGLVGEDGATHHGVFDISYLRHIPNMHVFAPRDEAMLQKAVFSAAYITAPLAIRYPRGGAVGVELIHMAPDALKAFEPFKPGQGQVLCNGNDVAVIALGSCVHPALEAAKQLEGDSGFVTTVFDACWAKPLPERQILDIARTHKSLLLVEENALAGGFSSAVLELLADHAATPPIVRRVGIEDAFVEHDTQRNLRGQIGIDAPGIRHHLEHLWAMYALNAAEAS